MKWQLKDDALLIKKYNEGMTHVEIGKLLRISNVACSKRLCKLRRAGIPGIAPKRFGSIYTVENVARIRDAYIKNQDRLRSLGENVGPYSGNTALAKELNITEGQMSYLVGKFGWHENNDRRKVEEGKPLTARGKSMVKLETRIETKLQDEIEDRLKPITKAKGALEEIQKVRSGLWSEVQDLKEAISKEQIHSVIGANDLKEFALTRAKQIRVWQRDLDVKQTAMELLDAWYKGTKQHIVFVRERIYEAELEKNAEYISNIQSQCSDIVKQAEEVVEKSKQMTTWVGRQVERIKAFAQRIAAD